MREIEKEKLEDKVILLLRWGQRTKKIQKMSLWNSSTSSSPFFNSSSNASQSLFSPSICSNPSFFNPTTSSQSITPTKWNVLQPPPTVLQSVLKGPTVDVKPDSYQSSLLEIKHYNATHSVFDQVEIPALRLPEPSPPPPPYTEVFETPSPICDFFFAPSNSTPPPHTYHIFGKKREK